MTHSYYQRIWDPNGSYTLKIPLAGLNEFQVGTWKISFITYSLICETN